MTYEQVARRPRVRAPELAGREWLNTGGRRLRLADLRGKVVLLDFWTFCCVNCLHVIDELRPLERRFADVLVTVGVHSPKFEHETDAAAVADAVERYEVHHPVLDDPALTTWRSYTARAWPTLVVVDPEGYVVAQLAGEGHAAGLAGLIEELVAEHAAKGTLHRGDGPYVPPPPPATELRFPSSVLPLPDGRLLVSDTANHRLVFLGDDLETVTGSIGSGERGLRDGGPGEARFVQPLGMALVPPGMSLGYDVLVADGAGHALRGVRISDGMVTTVAGTGTQAMQLPPPGLTGPALGLDLSTPWDVAWFEGRAAIAMAGVHQLWWFDPVAGTAGVLAGTAVEELRDGPAAEAWFAQPSGLAESGGTLWVADAETSALRRVRAGEVGTVIGTGLFDFGHRDGPADQAMLQHPLGVGVLPDGSVAVADTYDGAVRRYDPVTDEVSTLAAGLAEPTGVRVDPADPAALLVVESAAHRVVRVAIPAAAREVRGEAMRSERPPTALAPGEVTLEVVFVPPAGQHLDDRFGDPTRLEVSSTPASLLLEGGGRSTGLLRHLTLADEPGTLHVSVQAAACDDHGGAGAACHVFRQDWGIPLAPAPDGPSTLTLNLRARSD